VRITEASEYLGVSINTLKHMADSRQIRSYKTNGGEKMSVSKQCENMPIGTRVIVEVTTVCPKEIVRYHGLIVGGYIGEHGEYYTDIQIGHKEAK
jgi:excisionase family DNA binding protein